MFLLGKLLLQIKYFEHYSTKKEDNGILFINLLYFDHKDPFTASCKIPIFRDTFFFFFEYRNISLSRDNHPWKEDWKMKFSISFRSIQECIELLVFDQFASHFYVVKNVLDVKQSFYHVRTDFPSIFRLSPPLFPKSAC